MNDLPPKAIIEAKVLKGFRDMLPAQEQIRKQLLASIEKAVQQFGFVPIDTPVLEYTEVLLGKGGGETDKQMFRFEDNGGRDVALRFDLTVPFARFMVSNRPELYLPFKRYHFAKVWRGEKPQAGRYREFMQCDFDIVGVDSLSADFEILCVMQRIFKELGIQNVRFHINHRGVFNAFLQTLGVREHSAEILRIVDKLRKIGADQTQSELAALIGPQQASGILSFIQAAGPDPSANAATLANVTKLCGSEGEDLLRLRELMGLINSLGMNDYFYLDPSITRGLDYYTGLVYETFLTDHPSIGSVCSGGRYNDLASLYTKEQLPGVGSSVGIDRLIAALEQLGLLDQKPRAADVLVVLPDDDGLAAAHLLARDLQERGLSVEVFPQVKKLPQQYAHAERKGIPWTAQAGASYLSDRLFTIRELATRTASEPLLLEAAIQRIATV